MTIEEIRAARVALACLTEPGSIEVYDLVSRLGPAGAVEALVAGHVPEPVAEAVSARLSGTDPARLAERALAATRRLGARVVIPEDDEWPHQLADLSRISRTDGPRVDRDTYPPVCLWARGAQPLGDVAAQSVSVVGARAATSYGDHIAMELAYGLGVRDWAVVSGGAYGIDIMAHRGAMSGGGATVVVLACGVDRAYPAAHSGIFEQVVERGLLVSEWPPGTEPHRHRFLVRNRVIAALTRGTVIVDAAARSRRSVGPRCWAGSRWRYPVRSPRRCRSAATSSSGPASPGSSRRTPR